MGSSTARHSLSNPEECGIKIPKNNFSKETTLIDYNTNCIVSILRVKSTQQMVNVFKIMFVYIVGMVPLFVLLLQLECDVNVDKLERGGVD